MKPTAVFASTIEEGAKCASCGAPLTWAVIAKTQKRHPFNSPLEVLMEEVGPPPDRRRLAVVDLERTHFATCPDADKFRKAKGGRHEPGPAQGTR